MNIFKRLKKINYRHYILAAITIGFAACILLFPHSVGRIIESIRDFGLSMAYYFCEITEIPHNITPTVNTYPKYPFFNFLQNIKLPSTFLPFDIETFKVKWSQYWRVWASWANFKAYLSFLIDKLYIISEILLCVMPFFIIFYMMFESYLKKENNDYDKDSKSLQKWKRFSLRVITPIKTWFKNFFVFMKKHPVYSRIWFVLWALYFNFFAIAIEFVAYYFYLVVSFDFISLYIQIVKLFLDLWSILTFIPLWGWCVIGFMFFDRIRKSIGYNVLEHNEMKNRGFINGRPIVYMVCGTMGKKKTTAITDMALSQEAMFRDKAFEKLLENDMKFPNFPWINFENFIRRCMERHLIYNLATCLKAVSTVEYFWKYESTDIATAKSVNRQLKLRYGLSLDKQTLLFGYDFERYGLTYDDKLKVVDIWEVLKDYARLYFIYIIPSSLILSNYSIRTDGIKSDIGNFPMWDNNFFKRNNLDSDSVSRHAHILDFDMLRLGKKVNESNPNKDCFDFGVVMATEIGKERGNMIENIDKKKKDETANPKNDLFNSWLKMVRHSATVDKFPFVRVITDEQRPESWGADCRNLCDIVYIKESGDTKLAMPFFSLAELLYEIIFNKFVDLYYRYRFSRSDNTLAMYFLKNFTAKIHRYYSNIYNRFGYCALRVQVESGTQDGQISETNYYLAHKKIYSNRFSTDCFSDYFQSKALRSPVGINDLREYATEKATLEELNEQNSYFIQDLNDKRDMNM